MRRSAEPRVGRPSEPRRVGLQRPIVDELRRARRPDRRARVFDRRRSEIRRRMDRHQRRPDALFARKRHLDPLHPRRRLALRSNPIAGLRRDAALFTPARSATAWQFPIHRALPVSREAQPRVCRPRAANSPLAAGRRPRHRPARPVRPRLAEQSDQRRAGVAQRHGVRRDNLRLGREQRSRQELVVHPRRRLGRQGEGLIRRPATRLARGPRPASSHRGLLHLPGRGRFRPALDRPPPNRLRSD